jgi:hypothetical protein
MFTTYFFPVVCESYFSNEIPRIFLAKDAVKAPKQLKDLNNYTGSALGGTPNSHLRRSRLT